MAAVDDHEEARQVPLATVDAKLRAASTSAGVTVPGE
jgi:hypothetical protein